MGLVSGDVNIVSHVGECKQALQRQLDRAAEIIAGALESNAKREITTAVYDTPERGYVRTGNLRNSITGQKAHDGGDTVVIVGTNVEYAAYVELGTYKMAPRPYLRPAVERHASQYREILENELKNG